MNYQGLKLLKHLKISQGIAAKTFAYWAWPRSANFGVNATGTLANVDEIVI